MDTSGGDDGCSTGPDEVEANSDADVDISALTLECQ